MDASRIDRGYGLRQKIRARLLLMTGLVVAGAAALMPAGAQRSVTAASAQAGPLEMRWIPGGEFVMGTDDRLAPTNERPGRIMHVGGFWLDEHDVTNAQFTKFVEATGYVTTAERSVDWEELKKQVPPGTPKPADEVLRPGSLVYTPPAKEVPLDDVTRWWTWVPGASWKHPQGPASDIHGKDDFPVVQVSWDDAVAYSKWAGKRLPTEAEWEYAAHGGRSGTRFIWGDEFRPNGKFMANTYTGTFPVRDTAEDGYAGVSPVKAFPPNGYGLYDMAGNVWQWTADLYREPAAQAVCAACDTEAGGTCDPAVAGEVRQVIKGGSFLCNAHYCESYRPTARRGTPYDTGSQHVGFRCVFTDR